MKLTKSSLFLIAALTAASTAVSAQENTGKRLTASLDGASEVPGPGDEDGVGTASVRINPGQRQLCYSITVSGIDPARAAHIHEAAAGSAGPVVVGLAAPTGGTSQGCATITRELALEIIADPSDYYVNVHNARFPGGAVRGQLGE